jgi:hypothetical protein
MATGGRDSIEGARDKNGECMMAQHLYLIGETVAMRPHRGASSKAAGPCLVKARLPPLGDSLQYRIKCDGEPYERIVLEEDLIRSASRSIITATFRERGDSD